MHDSTYVNLVFFIFSIKRLYTAAKEAANFDYS